MVALNISIIIWRSLCLLYSFWQRVVDEWNKIPKKVIDSKTINIFKSQLNNHWKNLDIQFSPDIYQPGDGNKLLRRVQGAE
jgi:hypothetical protein